MTRYDKVLILAVLLFSLLGIYISSNQFDESKTKYAYIEVNGQKRKEIVFDQETSLTTAVETSYGYNEILIENGKVKMIEADCPDQICVEEKGIEKSGEIIVCLPNRVVVEIKGIENGELDYISN